jgi:hypothetical protein
MIDWRKDRLESGRPTGSGRNDEVWARAGTMRGMRSGYVQGKPV